MFGHTFLVAGLCLDTVLAVGMSKYVLIEMTPDFFEVVETEKVFDSSGLIACAGSCQTYTGSRCNGFHLVGNECKLIWADWKRTPGSGTKTKVYVDKDLRVTGADYKVLEEQIFDERFHGKYMLDNLKHHVCYGAAAYWQGPLRRVPATVKFDTLLTLNVRMVRLKNNHDDVEP